MDTAGLSSSEEQEAGRTEQRIPGAYEQHHHEQADAGAAEQFMELDENDSHSHDDDDAYSDAYESVDSMVEDLDGNSPHRIAGSSHAGQDPHERLQQQQKELRKHIIGVQQDTSLSPQEKAKKIQELMSGGWASKQKLSVTRAQLAPNKLQNRVDGLTTPSDEDKQPTWHSRESHTLGCKHYQRGAKMQANCCGHWFTCRFCHDEVSDHNLVRHQTRTMMCMHCSTAQPAAQTCANPACARKLARYYCSECKLWDDDPRKNIYHCKDCGICRIGKGLGIDYFHCDKCNICMAISLKNKHKCIERNLESDCPICGEYMFTSTSTVIFMPCGHCIHYKCHQEYIQTSYQCPTCFKSLANMGDYFRRIDAMLAQHQMPSEYANTQSHIYCNDCEKKSYTKFHFLYHKCGHCQGYNTKLLQTIEINSDGKPVIANTSPLLMNTNEPPPEPQGAEADNEIQRGSGSTNSRGGRTRRPSAVGASSLVDADQE